MLIFNVRQALNQDPCVYMYIDFVYVDSLFGLLYSNLFHNFEQL